MNCFHYHEPFIVVGSPTFRVHCSALNNERNKGSSTQVIPDFGLYADYSWSPTWRNEFVNWPDFSIPKDPFTAVRQISSALHQSYNYDVEIGCIGGHGRTGTMLACMLTEHLDIQAEQAIMMVRTKYCLKAIETKEQEQFVDFYKKVISDELWNDNKLFME